MLTLTKAPRLTLVKSPRLSLKKASYSSKHMTLQGMHNCFKGKPAQHVTLAQVYKSLVKQTNIQTAMAAGFIAAAVDLAHDCGLDADSSLVDDSTRKMVDSFVSEFYHANYDALMAHYDTGLYFHWGWVGVGSDLFLTVAGHGCGFWEHETGKPLSDWLENYGCEFYACNDGDDDLEGYECYMWKYGRV